MPIFLRSCINSFLLSFVKLILSRMTSPDVGFSRRFKQRINVLLPAPEWPMMPKISPASIVSEMLLSAVTGPLDEG